MADKSLFALRAENFTNNNFEVINDGTDTRVEVDGSVMVTGTQQTDITDLNQTISGTYSQTEVQAISDKVDEILAALRSYGLLG